jgi:hypothetical protein
MRLLKRLEAVESAVAKKSEGFIVVHCRYGESDDEAIARAGLQNWDGMAVLIQRFGDGSCGRTVPTMAE